MMSLNIASNAKSIFIGTLLAGVGYAAQADDSSVTAKKGIDKTLSTVNELLAKGTNAKEIANTLYENDLEIVVEGENPFYRGLKIFMPELQKYVEQPCVLKALDPIRQAGNLAVAWVSERCKATASGASDEEYRMIYVFRNGSKGWRVTMEMAAVGSF